MSSTAIVIELPSQRRRPAPGLAIAPGACQVLSLEQARAARSSRTASASSGWSVAVVAMIAVGALIGALLVRPPAGVIAASSDEIAAAHAVHAPAVDVFSACYGCSGRL